jgi:hypothetical protein
MAVSNSIQAIPLTSIDSATLASSYKVINAGGLAAPCFLIRIINTSGVTVTISYDGTTDNDVLAANSTLQLDFQENSQPNNYIAKLSKGTQIYAKGTAGTGLIYLAGYTQRNLN